VHFTSGFPTVEMPLFGGFLSVNLFVEHICAVFLTLYSDEPQKPLC